jgi:hypothetical protein
MRIYTRRIDKNNKLIIIPRRTQAALESGHWRWHQYRRRNAHVISNACHRNSGNGRRYVNYLLAPWRESNPFSASQGFPLTWWNPKIHNSLYKSTPLVLSLVIAPSHSLKIHFNIILSSIPGSPQRFFPTGLPYKTLYTPLFSSIHTTWPIHLIILDLVNRILFGEEYRS